MDNLQIWIVRLIPFGLVALSGVVVLSYLHMGAFEPQKAAGAGHQNLFDAMLDQSVTKRTKHPGEIVHSSQVVGGLGTAVQDNTEIWYIPLKILVGIEHPFRTAAGHGTAREKNRFTPLWQAVPGNNRRSAPFFILKDLSMSWEGPIALFPGCFTHGHEHGCRINVLGTDGGAQPA